MKRTILSPMRLILLCSILLGASGTAEEMRTWTSRAGTSLEAEFIELKDGRVTLRKQDNSTIRVKLSDLSQEDQNHVKELTEKEKSIKQAQEAEKALSDLGLKVGQQEVDVPRSLADTQSLNNKYLLYIPEDFISEAKEWPLVLFLHGAGERGSNISAITKHGPPKLAEKKQFPFILISPQCKADSWWNPADLLKLVEHIESTLAVDKKRIYITGLSMGGYGTWNMITTYPDKFAAAVPICGGANANDAKKIKDLPIWAFHGDQDKTVSIDKVQGMVDALKKMKSKDFEFTIYPGVGHDSWTKTYNNDEVFDWLLSHQKQ